MKKKTYKTVIALLFLIVISTLLKYQRGDVNHDGKYSTVDVVRVQRYILGLDNPCLIDKYCMDANSDFAIDEKDIEKIQRKIVGLE